MFIEDLVDWYNCDSMAYFLTIRLQESTFLNVISRSLKNNGYVFTS